MSWQKDPQAKKRTGKLTTKSGVVDTPFFMPDATRATVRGVLTEDLKKVQIEALVVNTYHLFVQPGEKLIAEAGGIHQFMQWDRPILSDSGGYQVFSLIHKDKSLGRITEDGAEFRVPTTGDKKLLTPERSIQVQFDLGVDIMICLDDPRPNNIGYEEMADSVERTIRWAKRCKDEFDRQLEIRKVALDKRPLLFGVVQGGKEKDLRLRCALALREIDFDGYGFGGRHIDEDGTLLEEIVRYTAEVMPEDKPRFALGVGTPSDIVRFYQMGWDMFDCVIPTREGRHGRLFVWNKEFLESAELMPDFYTTINITNAEHREDFGPVDSSCDCELCQKYSRSYLKHLFSVGEPLALTLASIHNLRFYTRLMEKLRK